MGGAPLSRPDVIALSLSCPDANVVDQFVSGRLATDAAGAVERHAARCDACRELLSGLARALETTVAGGEREGQDAPDDPPARLPALIADRYRLLRPLGSGGMSVVYAAHDPVLGRDVALKLLRAEARAAVGRLTSREARLLREARLMARLTHPNVVAVHDVGLHAERVFVAMELVDGVTLGDWLRTPRRRSELLRVFVDAARGLDAAHRAGVLHRDFKPDNVLIGADGRARVTDFGLARTGGEGPSLPDALVAGDLTVSGAVLGTPVYMSPEQFRGEPATPKSDQFSFCVALWEALFGARPFSGNTYDQLKESVIGGRMESPAARARVPRWLRGALARGLETAPAARHASMSALIQILTERPRRARRIAVAAAGVLLLAGGALAGHGLAGDSAPGPTCDGAGRRFDAVWTAGRRADIARAFAATGRIYAGPSAVEVSRALDGYRGRWVAAATEACRETRLSHQQPERVFELRAVCLERRLGEVRALVDVLGQADGAAVDRAANAVAALPAVDDCVDVATLSAEAPLPANPVARAAIEELEKALAHARVAKAAGRYPEALEVARATATAGGVLGYRPLEAEALLLQGELEMSASRNEARETLLQAVLAAEAGKHDRVAARGWADLYFQVGYVEADDAEAPAFARHARATLDRIGGDQEIGAMLERALGAVAAYQNRVDQAIVHFERALAAIERLRGPDDPAVAAALDNLGMALLAHHDLERADAAHRRALAIRERALGPDHPTVAETLQNLGNVAAERDQLTEAEPLLRRALAIRERSLPAGEIDVATALADLARVVSAAGRPAEALALDQRAADIVERAFGDRHPLLGHIVDNTGHVLVRLGRHQEAIAAFRRARAVFTASSGPRSLDVAGTWLAESDVDRVRGRRRAALAICRHALAILESSPATRESTAASHARSSIAALTRR
jgi:tetratricopeptide (TPR) repeat protein/predicted Ser/Thr protein kinase